MSGVRCSARLSAETAAASPAPGRGRPLAASAEAAARRARAAERAREVEDSPRVLRDKCRRLARALRNAKHLVVYTGAGISTAADIPDYRGPHGVWTRLRRGEAVGRVEVARARPTFTHMALTALWARGALKFVVSQNCDGLHLRAGLPRRALAELHGDMFAELCAACRAVYLRAFDTTERTARHQHATRRLCHACGAELRDSIVHFGERGRAAWPLNWAGALRHAARADVVLCLGSSLKVLRRYPRLWRMQAAPAARPQLYIVNLQWTPKDAVAALKINARCDAVMRLVARRLRLRVPRYRPALDPLLAHAEPLAEPERHTTRRAPLPPPAPAPLSDDSEPESPSASDSDEELPLRRLAERLRAPPPARPPRPPCPPEPPPEPRAEDDSARLRAFQVCMASGEATILLQSEHAPASPPAPPPAPASLTLDLRRFRMARRAPPAPATNGHGPAPLAHPPPPSTNGVACKLRRLLEYRPLGDPADSLDDKLKVELPLVAKTEPQEQKPELKAEPKSESVKAEPKSSSVKQEARSSSESEASSEGEALAAGSLAAAIIRRAVLLCRASLYPGLHTILAPAAAGAARGAGGACDWCARQYGARACLWYGPPRLTPLAARAWRGARGARHLCACCGPGAAPPAAPAPAAPAALDTAGWYGKGYRKGRRRR